VCGTVRTVLAGVRSGRESRRIWYPSEHQLDRDSQLEQAFRTSISKVREREREREPTVCLLDMHLPPEAGFQRRFRRRRGSASDAARPDYFRLSLAPFQSLAVFARRHRRFRRRAMCCRWMRHCRELAGRVEPSFRADLTDSGPRRDSSDC
jgi:hypothetical protein